MCDRGLRSLRPNANGVYFVLFVREFPNFLETTKTLPPIQWPQFDEVNFVRANCFFLLGFEWIMVWMIYYRTIFSRLYLFIRTMTSMAFILTIIKVRSWMNDNNPPPPKKKKKKKKRWMQLLIQALISALLSRIDHWLYCSAVWYTAHMLFISNDKRYTKKENVLVW